MDEEYDEDLFGTPSARGVGLEILEYWLEKEFWNFNRGFNQFDGYSEGHCILAGIDPERSMLTSDQYGPNFLPDAMRFYGCEIVTQENQWQLKEAIDKHVDDLKSLGLKGRVSIEAALQRSVDTKLAPPWLDAANNDFGCAKLLPAKFRTNSETTERIKREASSKGGRSRANKDAKTHLLKTIGREEFDRLRGQGFPDCRATTSNRVIATRVADKVYFKMSRHVGDDTENLPEITTVQEHVRVWRKNSAK